MRAKTKYIPCGIWFKDDRSVVQYGTLHFSKSVFTSNVDYHCNFNFYLFWHLSTEISWKSLSTRWKAAHNWHPGFTHQYDRFLCLFTRQWSRKSTMAAISPCCVPALLSVLSSLLLNTCLPFKNHTETSKHLSQMPQHSYPVHIAWMKYLSNVLASCIKHSMENMLKAFSYLCCPFLQYSFQKLLQSSLNAPWCLALIHWKRWAWMIEDMKRCASSCDGMLFLSSWLLQSSRTSQTFPHK